MSGLRFSSIGGGLRSLKVLLPCLFLLFTFACKRGPLKQAEMMYVSVPQANLRDRVSAVYNKVGVVYAGDKVEVLEKQKRFIHVKTKDGRDGWLELRYLAGQDVADGFDKLKTDNAKTIVQAHGTTRAELNIHLTPDREGDHLYQMKEGEKVEVLKKASAPRGGTPKQTVKPIVSKGPVKKADPAAQAEAEKAKTAAVKPTDKLAAEKADEPVPMEDWFLVRNSQGYVGWVLARMVDIDVPLDIAQYAEGQRIMGYFILNKVPDEDKQVAQYLVLMAAPRDGLPYDYDSIRVFSWNLKRHRYETAYRERNLWGVYPVTSGIENFGKEGDEPVFTIQLKDETGRIVPRKYRMIQPVIRRVLLPGQNEKTDPKLARPEPVKKAEGAGKKKKK
ncbi:SH3 domain-containing protein [Candidatus Korobacter versatilis]|uniref:SH3 domain-containing protein n=1 Tax=Candidatus Korobacter versatilis TaxID=658062 RepID=UPI0005A479DB|nr:SH3 domain-containing protein [Candidatus Koribacter versatilis]